MKQICVISELQPGSSRAHAINVIKTAGGFQRAGHDVTVLCRAPDDAAHFQDPGRTYAEPALNWQFAPAAVAPGEAFGEWATAQAASVGCDLVVARHFEAAIECAKAGLPTVLETHAYVGDERPLLKQTFAQTQCSSNPLTAISTISHRLRDYYTSLGANPDRIHIIPDGVDIDLFARPADIGESPFESTPDPIALYAGHLYDYKGIPTIIDAARLAPDISFCLLGGLPADIACARTRAANLPNLHVLGTVDHRDVPRWLWHADCLLLPPSATEPSANWTSPVKLGEYLASGTPIICSDIPALRDWVDEQVVAWFNPDDAESLVASTRHLLQRKPITGIQARLTRAQEFS